jgi:hypothetical protein
MTKICLLFNRNIRVILCENEVYYYNAKTFSYAFRHQHYIQTNAAVRRARLSFGTKPPTLSKLSVLENVENLGVARQLAPIGRREEPQDNCEFHVAKFSEFCAQICACFLLRLRCCLKFRDVTRNSLHFVTWATRKEVNSTAHGYLAKLFFFILMESSLSKLFHSGIRKIHIRFNGETITL